VANGPGGNAAYSSRFKSFSIPPFLELDVTPALGGLYGGRVGSALLDPSLSPAMLAASGPDPAINDALIPIRSVGGQPVADPALRPFGGSAAYGVSVAGGAVF